MTFGNKKKTQKTLLNNFPQFMVEIPSCYLTNKWKNVNLYIWYVCKSDINLIILSEPK